MEGMRIERGARVLAADGEVGRVTHVVVDPGTREVTEVVVDRGGRERVIPAGAIVGAAGDTVRVRGDRARYERAAGFNRDEFRGVDDDTAEAQSRGRAAHGGAALHEATADAVVVGAEAPPAGAPAERIVIPLAEERLAVGARPVELGAVLIRKRVEAERVSVPVALQREEVHVQERDIQDRPATTAEAERLFQEGTLRVPVHGEVAVVTKEAVVTGEVVLEKEPVTERQQLTDTVRKERVVADEDGAR